MRFSHLHFRKSWDAYLLAMSSVYFNDRVWQDEFLETVLDFTETVHVQSSRVHRKMFWAALAAIPLAIVKGELRQS